MDAAPTDLPQPELTPVTDPDREARRALRRYKRFALGLLLAMAALMIGAELLPPSYAVAVLQAGAKAGVVGGIADWFAVTALFRHPLGLPIPHTAIIPAQKARLGRALGRFVANHVFTDAEVRRLLGRLDLAGIVARFFADPAATGPAAAALARMLPRLLASVDDGRAPRLFARIVPRVLGGPGAGRVVAGALRKLMEGGRHQEVFGFMLGNLKSVLTEREGALKRVIEERVREQGGVLVGWALGASVARRVIGQINAELEKMADDGSDLRAAFDEWMGREISRIEEDPERAAEIGRAIRRVLENPSIRAWAGDVWARLRSALEADAARPGGRTRLLLEQALGNLGAMLETDEAARGQVQRAVEGVLSRLLPSAQVSLSGFIAEVVTHWDAATITEKLELRVGKDLQFVRLNGTLVGFLVGAALYVLLREVFGPVAF